MVNNEKSDATQNYWNRRKVLSSGLAAGLLPFLSIPASGIRNETLSDALDDAAKEHGKPKYLNLNSPRDIDSDLMYTIAFSDGTMKNIVGNLINENECEFVFDNEIFKSKLTGSKDKLLRNRMMKLENQIDAVPYGGDE